MHYYSHNIADFNNATRHLTRVERSLYRDLIELYYDTEQPLLADDFDRLARRVMASNEEEVAALRYVLGEYFILDGNVYRHERCDKEIAEYREKIEKKAKAGKASADAKKQAVANVQQVLNTCSTNQEPITNNQEPEEKEKEREAPPRKRGSRLPSDWSLPDDLAAWAKAERPDLDIRMEADRFRDYWAAKPGKDGVKLDWPATWRNWVRNAKNFARAGPQMRPRQDRRDDFYRQLRQGNGRDSNTERVINGEAERVD